MTSYDYNKPSEKTINDLISTSNKLVDEVEKAKSKPSTSLTLTTIDDLQKKAIVLLQESNQILDHSGPKPSFDINAVKTCAEHLKSSVDKINLLLVNKKIENIIKNVDAILVKKDVDLLDKEKLNQASKELSVLHDQLRKLEDRSEVTPLLKRVKTQLEVINKKLLSMSPPVIPISTKQSLSEYLDIPKEHLALIKQIDEPYETLTDQEKIEQINQVFAQQDKILASLSESLKITFQKRLGYLKNYKISILPPLYKSYVNQLEELNKNGEKLLAKKKLDPKEMAQLTDIRKQLVNLQNQLLGLLSTEIDKGNKDIELNIMDSLSKINEQLSKISLKRESLQHQEIYAKSTIKLAKLKEMMGTYLIKEELTPKEMGELVIIRDELSVLQKDFFFLTEKQINTDKAFARKIFDTISEIGQDIEKINVRKFDFDYGKAILKHEKESAEVADPFEAFRQGDLRIGSVIRKGQEGSLIQSLQMGPSEISAETLQVKKIFDRLLEDMDSVQFIKRGGVVFAIVEGEALPFSDLIKKVNFNHLTVTSLDLDRYHHLLDTQLSYKPQVSSIDRSRPTEESFNSKDPDKTCAALTLAEKEAINVYTGNGYDLINGFMRGLFDRAVTSNTTLPKGLSEEEALDRTLKEALIHTCIIVPALNKLPDFEKVGPSGEHMRYLFRGETGSCPDFVIENRKMAVEKGGLVEMEFGFMSTSYEKPNETFFSETSKAGVFIRNVQGKNIMALSQFGTSEREILLPPTQIQWRYHKQVKGPKGGNVDLFIARPVSVPTKNPTLLNPEKAHLQASKDRARIKQEKAEQLQSSQDVPIEKEKTEIETEIEIQPRAHRAPTKQRKTETEISSRTKIPIKQRKTETE